MEYFIGNGHFQNKNNSNCPFVYLYWYVPRKMLIISHILPISVQEEMHWRLKICYEEFPIWVHYSTCSNCTFWSLLSDYFYSNKHPPKLVLLTGQCAVTICDHASFDSSNSVKIHLRRASCTRLPFEKPLRQMSTSQYHKFAVLPNTRHWIWILFSSRHKF